MADDGQVLKWGIEQRLEFIEFRVFWEDGVNRADIIDRFKVSVPQASKDLTQYREIAPENLRYDASLKRYFASDAFKPRYLKPDASDYLMQMAATGLAPYAAGQSWVAQPLAFATIPQPKRMIDPVMLRQLLGIIRARHSVEIRYQSLNPDKPKPQWRRVTPHAFCFDGMRWHTRAYCHNNRDFRDFMLPRILGIRAEGEAGLPPEKDHAWQEIYRIRLTPHPAFSEEQRRAVASDYGMKDGEFEVPMRLAMLFYFLKHQRLDYNERERSPQQQHIVMADPDSVREAEARAKLPPVL